MGDNENKVYSDNLKKHLQEGNKRRVKEHLGAKPERELRSFSSYLQVEIVGNINHSQLVENIITNLESTLSLS